MNKEDLQDSLDTLTRVRGLEEGKHFNVIQRGDNDYVIRPIANPTTPIPQRSDFQQEFARNHPQLNAILPDGAKQRLETFDKTIHNDKFQQEHPMLALGGKAAEATGNFFSDWSNDALVATTIASALASVATDGAALPLLADTGSTLLGRVGLAAAASGLGSGAERVADNAIEKKDLSRDVSSKTAEGLVGGAIGGVGGEILGKGAQLVAKPFTSLGKLALGIKSKVPQDIPEVLKNFTQQAKDTGNVLELPKAEISSPRDAQAQTIGRQLTDKLNLPKEDVPNRLAALKDSPDLNKAKDLYAANEEVAKTIKLPPDPTLMNMAPADKANYVAQFTKQNPSTLTALFEQYPEEFQKILNTNKSAASDYTNNVLLKGIDPQKLGNMSQPDNNITKQAISSIRNRVSKPNATLADLFDAGNKVSDLASKAYNSGSKQGALMGQLKDTYNKNLDDLIQNHPEIPQEFKDNYNNARELYAKEMRTKNLYDSLIDAYNTKKGRWDNEGIIKLLDKSDSKEAPNTFNPEELQKLQEINNNYRDNLSTEEPKTEVKNTNEESNLATSAHPISSRAFWLIKSFLANSKNNPASQLFDEYTANGMNPWLKNPNAPTNLTTLAKSLTRGIPTVVINNTAQNVQDSLDKK